MSRWAYVESSCAELGSLAQHFIALMGHLALNFEPLRMAPSMLGFC